MSDIKNELSEKNPYYIPKHRYLELKHWCLQFDDWRNEAHNLTGLHTENRFEGMPTGSNTSNPTENYAIRLERLNQKMDLVKHCCLLADSDLANYIFQAVTEDRSFTYLQTVMDIPCCRDVYYDKYRKFFYILSQKKG